MKSTELQNIKGYTLVEVMVATLITFIVLGGVYQTIGRETMDMEKQEIILDMQNNARVAIERIARDVRQAGFLGCGGTLNKSTLNNAGTDDTLVGAKTSAVGATDELDTYWRGETTILEELKAKTGTVVDYLGASLGFANNAATGHPLYDPGTDALTLVYLANEVSLASAMAATNSVLTLAGSNPFAVGDIIYVTDCDDYSLLQKTADTDANSLTLEHAADTLLNGSDEDLGKRYGFIDPALVYSLQTSTFFVNGSELRHNLNDRVIAANIEDLQLEFIEDIDNDDDLVEEGWSATFTNSGDVRVVRVWLLAMSDEVFDYTNTETYSYAGKTYAPNDHRYRYLASTTVYLRNAGIN